MRRPVRCSASRAASEIPHLEKRGAATQLIVDGEPWLILGAELRGTASSTLVNMSTIWPELERLNLNTVLLALGWDWIEPEEGRFDFSLVDGLIDAARKHHQRIVFLWFGTWKNGISSFAPAWVKRDQRRFARARLQNGRSVEILSPFSSAALEADTRAHPSQQKVINNHCNKDWAEKVAAPWADFEHDGIAKLKGEPDHEVYPLTDAQLDQWKAAAVPVVQSWSAGVEKSGA